MTHVNLTDPFVLVWSLLEALGSGCAVVASDTAPVRKVIRHGENPSARSRLKNRAMKPMKPSARGVFDHKTNAIRQGGMGRLA